MKTITLTFNTLLLFFVLNTTFGQYKSQNEELLDYISKSDHHKVDSLLSKGCDPNFQETPNSATSLMCAAFESDLEMVKLLIKYGGNPAVKGLLKIKRANNLNFYYGSFLSILAGEGKSTILTYSIDSLKLNTKERELTIDGGEGMTPIMRAIEWGKPNACNILISNDSTVLVDLYKGGHPIFLCLKNHNLLRYEKQLILRKILPYVNIEKIRDFKGKTLFHYLDDNIFLFNILKDHKSIINVCDNDGNSPAHDITNENRMFFIDSLMLLGLNPNIKNSHGQIANYNKLKRLDEKLNKLIYAEYFYIIGDDKNSSDYYESIRTQLLSDKNLSIKYLNIALTLANSLKIKEDIKIYHKKIDSLSSIIPFFETIYELEYLSSLANNQAKIFNHYQADSLNKKCLTISEIFSGKINSTKCLLTNHMAFNEYYIGNLNGAITYTLLSKDLRKEYYGEDDINFSRSLSNLATLYGMDGRYYLQKELYEEAIRIKTKDLNGSLNASAISTINGYINSLILTGDFEKAEFLLTTTIDKAKEKYGEKSEVMVNLYNSYSGILQRLERFSEAEFYLKKAINVAEKLNLKNNNYFTYLSNLLQFYIFTGDIIKGETLIDKIVNTKYDEVILKNNYSSFEFRKLLFLVTKDGRNFEKYFKEIDNAKLVETDSDNKLRIYSRFLIAEKSYVLADSILKTLIINSQKKKQLNENYFDYQLLLAKSLSEHFGNDTAFNYLEVLKPVITDKKYNNLENVLLNYSVMSLKYVQKTKANSYLIDSTLSALLKNYPQIINRRISTLSHFQSQALIKKMEENFNVILGAYKYLYLLNENTVSELIKFTRYIKSIGLKNYQNQFETIRKTSDPKILAKYKSYRNTLEKYYSKTTNPAELAKLGLEVENLFNELVWSNNKSLVSIADNNGNNNVTRIEYVNIIETESKKSEYYGILTFQDKSEVFRVGSEEDILNEIKHVNEDVFYTTELTKKLFGFALTNKNIKSLEIVKAGVLNNISFGSLPVKKDYFLIDKFNISERLSNDSKTTNYSLPKAAIFLGNIDFEADSSNISSNMLASNAMIFNKSKGFSNFRGDKWSSLSYSKVEVSKSSAFLEKINIVCEVLEGSTANEMNVKNKLNFLPVSNILHFATHGYYSPPLDLRNENILGLNTNTDINGLVLAGANKLFLKGKSNIFFGDGVLTGNEISTMDLQNTKLVVLSACQTALGEIKGNEGVFGLQRAFKMAGVEYIIASLWKVPDAETAEMMILFYENLAKKESIEDAFRNAQLKMRKKYPPYYWAGFVLTR